tara:strand:+ start:9953 stop:10261 length:309 start_codon:yes stop_codon:yes gene_type:complete
VSIKRYNVKYDGDCLEEARDGTLVDYRVHRDLVYGLRQENAKLKEALQDSYEKLFNIDSSMWEECVYDVGMLIKGVLDEKLPHNNKCASLRFGGGPCDCGVL